MNTEVLKSFIEVVRQSSYTRASEALYLSQPTVYQHVKALERLLGTKLVEVSGKRVLPTANGRDAYSVACRLLDDERALVESARAEDGNLATGSLDLVVGATFADAFLPEALAAFASTFPAIKVRVTVISRAEEINEAVARHGHDGGIHSGDHRIPGLAATPLCKDELVLVTLPIHRLSSRESVTPHDLVDERLVGYSLPAVFRGLVNDWASASGVELEFPIELNSHHAIAMSVLAGAGVSIISRKIAEFYVAAGLLTAVDLAPRLRRTYYLVRRKESHIPRPLVEFCAHLSSDEITAFLNEAAMAVPEGHRAVSEARVR